MVGMFVRDENARKALGRTANGGEALARLARAEAGVNKNARLGGFEVGAVAAGTAAENRQLHGHNATVVRAGGGGNLIFVGERETSNIEVLPHGQ